MSLETLNHSGGALAIADGRALDRLNARSLTHSARFPSFLSPSGNMHMRLSVNDEDSSGPIVFIEDLGCVSDHRTRTGNDRIN